MCGICGYINFKANNKTLNKDILAKMVATLKHRGPDEKGCYLKGKAALGHRRLSIIDLTTGQQPMSIGNGRFTVAYNGEVYNFPQIREDLEKKNIQFKTKSDTEVILKSYSLHGKDCLKLFNGMFAFAIWDSVAEELFLARDRFGQKPLYYTLQNGFFIFASEIKAILQHPMVRKEIDPISLSKYLAYDYTPNPRSIFKEIYKLEPAHCLFANKETIKKEKYWDINNKSIEVPGNIKLIKEHLIELLRESVRKRLISDVPLGVFLSGGIDSSAIVAMMAGLMKPKDIKTFTIGFKAKGFDESKDARLIADYFNTTHHEKILEPKHMLDALEEVTNVLDEPFNDSSIIPTYLVSKFARRHVKTVLGGDGGDELFLGYPSFKGHKYAWLYDNLPQFGKNSIKSIAKLLPASTGYMNIQFLANKVLRGLDYDDEAIRCQVWLGIFPPNEQKDILKHLEAQLIDEKNMYSESLKYFGSTAGKTPLQKISYLYLKTYLVGDILTKVDRASMANSLEVRAPFLDPDLAEFAYALREDIKLHGLTTKYILKKSLQPYLPKSIFNKTKHGFAVPVGKWFREDLKGVVVDMFEESKIKKQDIFNYKKINKILNEHISGKRDRHRELWSLFMFQKWFDKWMS